MKRQLSILCALLLLISIKSIAFADMPDLSNFSDAELVELLSYVNEEVVNRRIEKTAELSSGEYIIGVDIPAGSYNVISINGKLNDYLLVSRPDSTKDTWVMKNHFFLHDDEAVHLTLIEGQKITTSCSFTLKVSVGAKFF